MAEHVEMRKTLEVIGHCEHHSEYKANTQERFAFSISPMKSPALFEFREKALAGFKEGLRIRGGLIRDRYRRSQERERAATVPTWRTETSCSDCHFG